MQARIAEILPPEPPAYIHKVAACDARSLNYDIAKEKEYLEVSFILFRCPKFYVSVVSQMNAIC